MFPLSALLGVALGGAIGSVLRLVLGQAIGHSPSGFPWGTLVVNLLGCLAIGALAGWDARGGPWPEGMRLAVAVGLLGGFTTFSSFGLETFRLLHAGHVASACSYLALTNGGGLAAVVLGYRLVGRT